MSKRTAMQVLQRDRAPLPEPSVVAVVFKSEDQVDGEDCGPVWGRLRSGELQPHQVQHGRPRWFSRGTALAIAEACGLEFEEV